jgi:hypothetical protein
MEVSSSIGSPRGVGSSSTSVTSSSLTGVTSSSLTGATSSEDQVVELVTRLVSQPLLHVLLQLRGGRHPTLLKVIAGIALLSHPNLHVKP